MTADTRFSVIIPTYNASRYLPNALNSVLEQNYSAYEIIIVDDGSTDNTSKILLGISTSKIKYFYQKNGGPSKARNTGILKSSGDYIAFLDADDIWYPNHLSDAYKFFNENPNVFWFSSAFDISYRNIIKSRVIKTQASCLNYFDHSIKTTFINASVVIINREIFNKVGLFSENWSIGEDLNLWIRIALQYPIIGYCTTPGSNYIKTEGSLTFNKTNYNLRNTLKVLYFTNKEVEASKNKAAISLINYWIEDAVFNAIIRKNKLVLSYVKHRWSKKIGLGVKFILFTHRIFPLIFIRALNWLNKTQRKMFKTF